MNDSLLGKLHVYSFIAPLKWLCAVSKFLSRENVILGLLGEYMLPVYPDDSDLLAFQFEENFILIRHYLWDA